MPYLQFRFVVSPDAPLAAYKLVVAPSLNVLPKSTADHLLEYVRNGGSLVLGPRSAMKDEYNSLAPERQPGDLLAALQGRVEQYYALESDFPVSGKWGNGKVSVWAEQLKSLAPDAEVLMRYGKSNGWLDDQPAVISRAYGKGRITYIGAVLDDQLMSAAADWMVQQSGVKQALGPLPDGVQVSRRVGGGKDTFVLINFTREDRLVKLPRAMKQLMAGRVGDSMTLPPYGVELLQTEK